MTNKTTSFYTDVAINFDINKSSLESGIAVAQKQVNSLISQMSQLANAFKDMGNVTSANLLEKYADSLAEVSSKASKAGSSIEAQREAFGRLTKELVYADSAFKTLKKEMTASVVKDYTATVDNLESAYKGLLIQLNKFISTKKQTISNEDASNIEKLVTELSNEENKVKALTDEYKVLYRARKTAIESDNREELSAVNAKLKEQSSLIQEQVSKLKQYKTAVKEALANASSNMTTDQLSKSIKTTDAYINKLIPKMKQLSVLFRSLGQNEEAESLDRYIASLTRVSSETKKVSSDTSVQEALFVKMSQSVLRAESALKMYSKQIAMSVDKDYSKELLRLEEGYDKLSFSIKKAIEQKERWTDPTNITKANSFYASLKKEEEEISKLIVSYKKLLAEKQKAILNNDSAKLAAVNAELAKQNKLIQQQTARLREQKVLARNHIADMTQINRVSWVKEIGKRALGYASVYASIYEVIHLITSEIKYIANVDKYISRINAVLDVSKKKAGDLEKKLIDITTEYGVQLDTVNEVTLALGRAGFATEHLAEATKIVVQMAILTGESTEQAVDALVSFDQVYGNILKKSGEFNDYLQALAAKLAYAANISKLSMQGLATVANYSLGISKQLGVSLNMYLSMVAALKNAGQSDSTTGTLLRRFYTMLQDSNEAVDEFYKKLGLSRARLTAMLSAGGAEADKAMSIIIKRLGATSDAQIKQITASLQILDKTAVLQIRNNWEAILDNQEKIKNVTDEQNNLLDKSKEATDNMVDNWDKIGNSIKRIFLDLSKTGDSLFPNNNDLHFLGSVASFLDYIDSKIKEIQNSVKANGGILQTFLVSEIDKFSVILPDNMVKDLKQSLIDATAPDKAKSNIKSLQYQFSNLHDIAKSKLSSIKALITDTFKFPDLKGWLGETYDNLKSSSDQKSNLTNNKTNTTDISWVKPFIGGIIEEKITQLESFLPKSFKSFFSVDTDTLVTKLKHTISSVKGSKSSKSNDIFDFISKEQVQNLRTYVDLLGKVNKADKFASAIDLLDSTIKKQIDVLKRYDKANGNTGIFKGMDINNLEEYAAKLNKLMAITKDPEQKRYYAELYKSLKNILVLKNMDVSVEDKLGKIMENNYKKSMKNLENKFKLYEKITSSYNKALNKGDKIKEINAYYEKIMKDIDNNKDLFGIDKAKQMIKELNDARNKAVSKELDKEIDKAKSLLAEIKRLLGGNKPSEEKINTDYDKYAQDVYTASDKGLISAEQTKEAIAELNVWKEHALKDLHSFNPFSSDSWANAINDAGEALEVYGEKTGSKFAKTAGKALEIIAKHLAQIFDFGVKTLKTVINHQYDKIKDAYQPLIDAMQQQTYTNQLKSNAYNAFGQEGYGQAENIQAQLSTIQMQKEQMDMNYKLMAQSKEYKQEIQDAIEIFAVSAGAAASVWFDGGAILDGITMAVKAQDWAEQMTGFKTYQQAYIDSVDAYKQSLRDLANDLISLAGEVYNSISTYRDIYDAFADDKVYGLRKEAEAIAMVNQYTDLSQESLTNFTESIIQASTDFVGEAVDASQMLNDVADGVDATTDLLTDSAGDYDLAVTALNSDFQNAMTLVSQLVQGFNDGLKQINDYIDDLKASLGDTTDQKRDRQADYAQALQDYYAGKVDANTLIDKAKAFQEVANSDDIDKLITSLEGTQQETTEDYLESIMDYLDDTSTLGLPDVVVDQLTSPEVQTLDVLEDTKSFIEELLYGGGWFSGAFMSIEDLIKQVIKAIGKVAGQTWDAFKDAMTDVWLFVRNFFNSLWKDIWKVGEAIWEFEKNALIGLWDWTKEFFKTLFDSLKAVFKEIIAPVIDPLKSIADAVKDVLNAIKSVADAFDMGGITDIFTDPVGSVSNLWTTTTNILKDPIGSISHLFADGGYTGTGTYVDSTGEKVAGIVHEDEWVAPKWMVDTYSDLFAWLENGRVSGGLQMPSVKAVNISAPPTVNVTLDVKEIQTTNTILKEQYIIQQKMLRIMQKFDEEGIQCVS